MQAFTNEQIGTYHGRYMQQHPQSTISAEELDLLNHISRWGSDGYPIFKRGRKWWVDPFFGTGGFPTGYRTKRDAIAQFESYVSILLDKAAGRV